MVNFNNFGGSWNLRLGGVSRGSDTVRQWFGRGVMKAGDELSERRICLEEFLCGCVSGLDLGGAGTKQEQGR